MLELGFPSSSGLGLFVYFCLLPVALMVAATLAHETKGYIFVRQGSLWSIRLLPQAAATELQLRKGSQYLLDHKTIITDCGLVIAKIVSARLHFEEKLFSNYS